MPDPTVTQASTPPGSVIVVRVDAAEVEETFTLAKELHRQTGLTVVVTTPGADLSVTIPEEAVAALTDALTAVVTVMPEPEVATSLLDELAAKGWELVRLRQP